VLGIDLGTRRIGLAVSDEDGRIAFPAGTLERKSKRADFAALCKLVRERQIGCAVVGLPLHMSGRAGVEAEAARAFATALAEDAGSPVDTHD
jgi:putative Holliday junction resolvase